MARTTTRRPGPRHAAQRVMSRRYHRVLKALFYLGLLGSSAALLLTGVYVWAQLKLRENAETIAVSRHTPPEPRNVLIVGSDTREGLSAEEKRRKGALGGRRADTLILVHIDEKREKAVLVHFPRDLRIVLPDGSVGKINAAYGFGPDALVATIEKFTGLELHHYVEVNFVGFRNMVNTLGGLDVYFEQALRDQDSELNVPRGCVTLRGEQALAFVRVRKIDSDFGRIARQQLFLRLMMDKVISAGTLLNPLKVRSLVNTFADNVKTDAQLNIRDILGIAGRLRGFDSSRVDMRVVPSSSMYLGGVSYVIHDEAQTRLLFDALEARKPIPDVGETGISEISKRDVRITVLNGTRREGLAGEVAEFLREKGFSIISDGNARRANYPVTKVFYEPGHDKKAAMVARTLRATASPLPSGSSFENSEVVVVVGASYQPGRPPPGGAPAGRVPGPPEQNPLVHACDESA